eukprot:CAMPEP_0176424676 /NCGR_PEP_ID=MMETSP0127-20121128/10965_1 /TAXON_ID=938130 /ORGANISM="Platyophrya macrostoma, Strain WH" /LENGTH=565 /DNA_ID=CAMNT_0017805751 /DNA_START=20 /DNA_END=1717 /DNA_ORIENTATION=+
MAKKSKHSKISKVHEKFKQRRTESIKNHRKSASSTNPDRKSPHGSDGFYRSKATIKRLNMYRDKPDIEKMHERPTGPARIDPDRKYFGNVRTLDQKQLERMRVELAQQTKDPFKILIKQKQLPISLISEETKENKMNILEVETFEDTFGPKSKRKRPKLDNYVPINMLAKVEEKLEGYKMDKDRDLHKNDIVDSKDIAPSGLLKAGQSKRIWDELYKVLDSSDVICCILDARDPMGTRCMHVEQHLRKNAPHKHVILILNKCDLIPTWLTSKWMKYLSKEYPTLAYHASVTNPFGKGALIQLLKQFDNFHRDAKNISVGFIGYPNVGKSSVINSLKGQHSCKAAPVPGETKVWQYVTLTKRIYLIDCPGVVYSGDDQEEQELVLKGVVRAERLEDTTYYIPFLLQKAKKSDLEKIYSVTDWDNAEEFLEKFAIKNGKLLKGGEPDTQTAGRMILMDWQRGRIPYYTMPPGMKDEKPERMEKEENGAMEEEKQEVNAEMQEENGEGTIQTDKAAAGSRGNSAKRGRRGQSEGENGRSKSEDKKPKRKKQTLKDLNSIRLQKVKLGV